MLKFEKFLNTNSGKCIMSLLLGFGFASLFRTMCYDKNCIIFKAPPLEKLENKIFTFGNKCVKYNISPTKCDTNKTIIKK